MIGCGVNNGLSRKFRITSGTTHSIIVRTLFRAGSLVLVLNDSFRIMAMRTTPNTIGILQSSNIL